MGFQNVSIVYARWAHLPHGPFRLLTYMALRSLDDDKPPMFFEGREACALAIGRSTPDEPARSDETKRAIEFRKIRHADFEAVRLAMRVLIEKGTVAVDQQSSPRNHARYSLHLMTATGQAQPAEQGRPSLRTGQAQPAEQGRPSLPLTTNTPYGSEHENTKTRPNSSQSGTSPAADLGYPQASKLLESMPDLGAQYLARVGNVDGLQNRVIAAAELARTERNSA